MKAIVKLIFCLLFLVIYIKSVQMITTVKLTNAICESMNKTWVTIQQCRLRAISRNMTVLNMELNVQYPAHAMDLKFQIMKRANGYKPWLANYTIDFCAFVLKGNHPVVKIFWKMLKQFSTLGHPCPYVGKYYVRNFFWDARNFSLPFPGGDYVLLLTWIFDKKPQFVTNVYFTFYQDLFKD